MLVAYDESPHADRALQAFETSGLDFGQEVIVMSVAATEDVAKREGEEAVEFLKAHDIRATACTRHRGGVLDE